MLGHDQQRTCDQQARRHRSQRHQQLMVVVRHRRDNAGQAHHAEGDQEQPRQPQRVDERLAGVRLCCSA